MCDSILYEFTFRNHYGGWYSAIAETARSALDCILENYSNLMECNMYMDSSMTSRHYLDSCNCYPRVK